MQQQLQMQIMATKQQALQMQLAQQAVKPPENPLAALLGAAIPQVNIWDSSYIVILPVCIVRRFSDQEKKSGGFSGLTIY